jgi:hypothetical protein
LVYKAEQIISSRNRIKIPALQTVMREKSDVMVPLSFLEKGASTPASASIDAYGCFINLLRSYTNLLQVIDRPKFAT